MEPVAKAMNLAFTAWIMPRAPYTIKSKLSNKRGETYSWSSKSVRKENSPQKKDIIRSIIILNKCLKVLKNKSFKEKDIFILGFSQGAMMSFELGKFIDAELAGCILLSGRILPSENHDIKKFNQTPILIVHGDKDTVLLPKYYFEACDILKNYNF